MSALPAPGGFFDGVYDLLITRASAKNRRNRLTDLITRRIRVMIEERFPSQDHCRRAIPTLNSAMLHDCFLNLAETSIRTVDSFDGSDTAAIKSRGHYQAREDQVAVEYHCTSAAIPGIASAFRAGQFHVFAQQPEESQVARKLDVDRPIIQRKIDSHRETSGIFLLVCHIDIA